MAERRVLLGVIGRAHGTRGLVRVVSYTAVPGDLAAYSPLSDEAGGRFSVRWAGEGIAEIAELVDGAARPIRDRGAAEKLTNRRLYVDRDQLPPPDEDEFYVADLVGLAAIGDAATGRVVAVHDYGAGTSLEIAIENAPALLLPFTRACVPEVDITAGRIRFVAPFEQVSAEPVGAEAAE